MALISCGYIDFSTPAVHFLYLEGTTQFYPARVSRVRSLRRIGENGPGTRRRRRTCARPLVAELVMNFSVDLAGIVVMKSVKGQAVIDQQMPVGHIQY